jgi:phenylalanyl-tRNA synthetase alpha chain
MEQRIQELLNEVESYHASDKQGVENFRLQYISKKGVIGELFEELKSLSPEQKKNVGKILNQLKQTAEAKFTSLSESLASTETSHVDFDLSLPPIANTLGNLHPLSLTKYRIIEIFERLGFNVADGPEIEDDWHNFSALNFPENHPAREMQDTFFIQKGKGEARGDMLLRTHTSNVQIRMMENRSRRFAQSCREGSIATKRSRHGHTVSFIRLKASTLIGM